MPLLAVEQKRPGNPQGTPAQLLHDPEARRQRCEEKATAVLRFLREEIYSASAILGRVMGVASRPAVHKTLERMEEMGLLKRAEISKVAPKRLLWGITSKGQTMAFDPGRNEDPVTKVFELSKVSDARLQHTLTLQTMRLDCLAKQWTGWRSCDRGVQIKSKADKRRHRADTIVVRPDGVS